MFLTALILGITGSLHCAGMCSPLVMAVTGMKRDAMIRRIVYNTGRILVYAALGAIISAFGSLFGMSGLQIFLSVALGILFIFIGAIGVWNMRIPFLTSWIQGGVSLLKITFASVSRIKSPFAVLFMGMLNGLLPCGLSSLALTSCILLPSASDGFLFMLIFGMGTLPVMIGLAPLLGRIFAKLQFSFKNVVRASLILAGILLISRSFLEHRHSQNLSDINPIVVCE